MAKNESTAVNELIHRVATMKPLPPDPSDDIMFTPPRKAAPSQQTGGRAEGAPLPRSRSANGTPVGAMTMQGLGPRPMTPAPGKPSAAMTMQGLGPVVQRAMAAAKRPRPPQSVDDGWTEDEHTTTPIPVQASQAQPRTTTTTLPVQASQAQPRARTSQSHAVQPPPPPLRRQHTTTAPRMMPVAAPFESGSAPSGSMSSASSGRVPAAQEPMPVSQAAEPAAAIEVAPGRPWFEQVHAQREQAQAPEQIHHEEAWIGTLHVRSRRRSRSGALVAALVVLTIAGVFAGYFAFDGQGGQARAPRAAAVSAPAAAVSAPVAAPRAAAEPAAVKAAEPAPASIPTPMPSKFVDVMLLSTPAGATVTLVDRGKTSFIGTTPVATALDPSRKYDLVFSHPGKPTRIEPIDPSTTRRVDIRLDLPGAAARPAIPKAEPKLERASDAAASDAAASDAPRAEKAVAAPAGEGILMISSKPPCEIVIDGKPTGLTTPQRDITLSAGSHKVTLVNKDEDINKTISVQISADKPTKVIQDLMQ